MRGGTPFIYRVTVSARLSGRMELRWTAACAAAWRATFALHHFCAACRFGKKTQNGFPAWFAVTSDGIYCSRSAVGGTHAHFLLMTAYSWARAGCRHPYLAQFDGDICGVEEVAYLFGATRHSAYALFAGVR
jgi:hypothetical protein